MADSVRVLVMLVVGLGLFVAGGHHQRRRVPRVGRSGDHGGEQFMGDSKLLGRLYTVIVVNLLLWLVVIAFAYRGANTTNIAVVGFVFSAVAQHWAYYALRKAGQRELR